MDFKEAMKNVEDFKVAKVTPVEGKGTHPHLVKVDSYPDLDMYCLQCVCLTEDGTHLEPDCDWEPVCYLFCFEDIIDGEWEIVNEDDFKEVE